MGSEETARTLRAAFMKFTQKYQLELLSHVDQLASKHPKEAPGILFIDATDADEFGQKQLKTVAKQQPNLHLVPILAKTSKAQVKKWLTMGAIDYLLVDALSNEQLAHILLHSELIQEKAESLDQLSCRYQSLVSSVNEGVLECDEKGVIQFINTKALKLMGRKKAEVIGQPIIDFIRLQNAEGLSWAEHPLLIQSQKKQRWRTQKAELQTQRSDAVPIKLQSTPLLNNGSLDAILVVFEDLAIKNAIHEKLSYLADHDPLTGLGNRNFFNHLLPKILSHAERTENQVALLFLDLDHFKNVNDTLGHDIGDQLLIKVSQRLTDSLRKSDHVIRLGGDEFTVVMEGKLTATRVATVARRIISAISESYVLESYHINIGVSIGVAFYPSCAESAEELIKCADVAMYNAKKEGGNAYSFYTLEYNQQVSERMILEGNFRSALDKDEISIRYEPRVEFSTGTMIGCEAILQWKNPELGNVSPSTFIPIAEECGLIQNLGYWALKNVCQQIKVWEKKGLGKIPVSLNVSMRQLMSPNFAKDLFEIIHAANVEPSLINIELLETNLMAKPEDFLPILHDVSALGVGILIDHFGAGYSYLSYLHRMPVDKIKIDRSLIRDVADDINTAMIVKAIIQLAHNLGIKVIAEDIETKPQHDFMRKQGCDEGEGKYFGYSLNTENFVEYLGIRKHFEKEGIVLDKWRCLVCDYLYHEEQGLPEKMISPGTLWKDLSEEWACPDCHAEKTDFEKIKRTSH